MLVVPSHDIEGFAYPVTLATIWAASSRTGMLLHCETSRSDEPTDGPGPITIASGSATLRCAYAACQVIWTDPGSRVIAAVLCRFRPMAKIRWMTSF
jgi:hypothetical protein